jgi:deoxyribodipyrimidine photo-lyase
MLKEKITLFWYRRDLRLHDNAAFYHALKSGYKVLPLFIFDKNILDKLEEKADRRVEFIHQVINEMQDNFKETGSSMIVEYGKPEEIWKELIQKYSIAEVHTNHDYEKYGKDRDKEVGELLNGEGIAFYTSKDQVIFEKNEILTNSDTPYKVFTPYSRTWKEKLSNNGDYIKPYPTEENFENLLKSDVRHQVPSLESMGFKEVGESFPDKKIRKEIIEKYEEQRDIPAIKGTTEISIHLRFGTVSIRELVHRALEVNEKWLNELIWRDFYMNILWHFPHINEEKSFRQEYDRIEWRNNEEEFKRWCEGKTGFPIVDAGMRQLNETGFMHNRVRMITSSFLIKDLLVDWRWGEAYFAKKLRDFEFSSNNGGWQWAAGSGVDAAPYFRVFNPDAQTKKFDPDYKYIKQWIPEFGTRNYPKPMVDHKEARLRALRVYKEGLDKKE